MNKVIHVLSSTKSVSSFVKILKQGIIKTEINSK